MEYVIYQDSIGDWRWYFQTNGRKIADCGQGYTNKADAERGIEIMKASTLSPVRLGAGGLLGMPLVGKP